MKNLSVTLCAIVFFSCQAHGATSEEDYLNRIGNHLLIQDHSSACQESLEALTIYPHSRPLHENRIKALARAGDEKQCLSAWDEYSRRFPDEISGHQAVLEEMAWGTIYKTAASHSPPLRLMGILAALLSQDSRGIGLIKQGLSDRNILVRATTVKLAGHLHDAVLLDEIGALVTTEKSWKVRVEAINAAGSMKLKAVRPFLLNIAGDPSRHAVERAAAISAFVQMQKQMPRQELAKLVKSDRAGMRMLACEIVAFLQLNDDVDLLMPLLNDYSAEVRIAILRTAGTLRVPLNLKDGAVVNALDDPNPLVAMTAAWVTMLSQPSKGQAALKKYLSDEDPQVRRGAAAALVAAGHYAFPLMETAFEETEDPYVRLNLALGLIGQCRQTEAAANVVFSFLTTIKEQLMDHADGLFAYIGPSDVKHDEQTPNAPEAVNQKTRLKLLNILAVLKHPRAQEAVKLFLQEKKWGISGMAAAVLLTEGDDQALDLVKGLLNDPDPSTRLQAAFVLALWGTDEEALSVLQNAYPTASHEDKEKIVEGIGRVGSKKSLPFLIDRLRETHQSLRLIAAAGIVQILYH